MMRSRHWLSSLLLALGGLVAGGVGASEQGIPAPRDVDYAGTIRLQVDASDVDRRVVRVEEVVPVGAPGPLTLLYPRWLPGNNSTTGPIEMLAGLQVCIALPRELFVAIGASRECTRSTSTCRRARRRCTCDSNSSRRLRQTRDGR
jgi:hypothetical protein